MKLLIICFGVLFLNSLISYSQKGFFKKGLPIVTISISFLFINFSQIFKLLILPVVEINIFDLYEGEGIPQGKKSIAISIVLQPKYKTLKDSDKFPPQAHIFLKDKDPWLNLSDKAKCFEAAYDRDKTWPEESIKRYNDHLRTIK